MAKYTELFTEYIENGWELPTVFSKIEGFSDLFLGHFCDHEIGFETEELFNVKLETRARIIIPFYADRLAAIKARFEGLNNPSKSYQKTVQGGERGSNKTFNGGKRDETVTNNMGEQKARAFDLPMNDTTADPTGRTEADSYTDTETTAKQAYTDSEQNTAQAYTDTETNTETGFTVDENLKVIQALTDFQVESQTLLEKCLHEFDCLFMRVY